MEARLQASIDLYRSSQPAAYAKDAKTEAASTSDDEDLQLEENAQTDDGEESLQLEDNADEQSEDDDLVLLEDNVARGSSDDDEDDALLLEENADGAEPTTNEPKSASIAPSLSDDPLHGLLEVIKIQTKAPELRKLVEVARQAVPSRQQALRCYFEGADAALAATLGDAGAHETTCAVVVEGLCKFAAVLSSWPSDMPVILRHSDQGFFASFLSVMDALLMAPPDAEVKVDWTLSGLEKEFTYGKAGEDVWSGLFEPVHLNQGRTKSTAAPLELRESRFNHFLRGEHKFEFRTSKYNAAQRAAYNRVFSTHIRVRHASIINALATLGKELSEGTSVGVHKRIDTPGTRMNQGLKGNFSIDEYVEAARLVVTEHETRTGCAVTAVYLATDDEAAERAFRVAFGERLCVRRGVTRVRGGVNPDGTHNEVHSRTSPFNPTCTLQDAADVLTDALLLAKCDLVLHADSNVTTAVSLIAPASTGMRHITDVLGRTPPVIEGETDALRLKRAQKQQHKMRSNEAGTCGANGALTLPSGESPPVAQPSYLAGWQEPPPEAASTSTALAKPTTPMSVIELMGIPTADSAQLAREAKQAPPGWYPAYGRLWGVIMHMDADSARRSGDLPKGDPLTPLSARLLLRMTEAPSGEKDAVTGEHLPQMTKTHLINLLNDPKRLKQTCDSMIDMAFEDIDGNVANGNNTPTAGKRLRKLAEVGTTLAIFNVRKIHANGKLPVRYWDPPRVRPAQPLRLPPGTTAAELWQHVLDHRPVVIEGGFPGVVHMFSPPALSMRAAGCQVPCRHNFKDDGSGRRVFAAQKSDMTENANKPLDFGTWVRDAGHGRASAREVYPAKMPLRRYLRVVADDLDAADTPFSRFGACIGQGAAEGVYCYAGAGANTTHTHLDPAENLMFVAAGTKRLQLFAPGDVEHLYPWPAPMYHSSAVPPFSSEKKPPVEFPAYAGALPIEVELREGDMLYLPAFWYHAVQGGDGFNVVLAWWAQVHPNKRDEGSGAFEPVRPAYDGPGFMQDAVDELKFKEDDAP